MAGRPAGAASPARRRLLGGLAGLGSWLALGSPLQAARAACPVQWTAWHRFVERHVNADGRVIDFANADLRSTSESQSYGLFFALVDNDPVLFERILSWTRHNLSRGRPDLHLPAWLWGQAPDGSWRVLDPNTAADGELWIAYALLEAGRLWKRPGFTAAARQILRLIRQEEVRDLPGLGPMLLPGREGFVHEDRWTLNPSYLPPFILRRFATVDPSGPWKRIAANAARMLQQAAPAGFAPDWVAWDGRQWMTDPARGGTGSYDAIRCYLWAGMTASTDPLRARLLAALKGPLQRLHEGGAMPERVQVGTGAGSGKAPPGFSAALLPYLAVQNQPALLQAELARLPASWDALPYYDRVLLLFGTGWHEHRYRFSTDGRLVPAWSSACSASI